MPASSTTDAIRRSDFHALQICRVRSSGSRPGFQFHSSGSSPVSNLPAKRSTYRSASCAARRGSMIWSTATKPSAWKAAACSCVIVSPAGGACAGTAGAAGVCAGTGASWVLGRSDVVEVAGALGRGDEQPHLAVLLDPGRGVVAGGGLHHGGAGDVAGGGPRRRPPS